MSRTVVKKGHADWADLIGKTISYEWYDGYEYLPYYFEGVFEGTRPHAEDPRYPRYYILIDGGGGGGGGGASVWEDEEITVEVFD